MLELIIALFIILITVNLIRKKYDIKVMMFGSGLVMMLVAIFLGHEIMSPESSSGIIFMDVFRFIGNSFTNQLGGAGFIIMLLFGYTAYMKEIGANEMTVRLLSAPLQHLKHKDLMIPIFFIIGNLLCIIIPSASSLAVLLMSTAYPILVKAGASPLGVAAVIATSATIAPTPLGIDNVLAANALSMSLTDYVFNYHAIISIPIIFILAFVHYFWQKWCDKRDGETGFVMPKIIDFSQSKKIKCPKIYAILPMLPLILMIIVTIFFNESELDIIEVTLFSFVIAIVCEIIRLQSFERASGQIEVFFKGMGTGFTAVIVQVVAALTFVGGLRMLGVIDYLTQLINEVNGGGFLVVIAFCLLVLFVGTISGSGLALFFAFIDLVPTLAAAANIPPVMLAIPMQFTAHFVKSISPLAPTVVITSSMAGITPMKLIKRTIVPSIVGIMLSILFSYFIF